MSGLTNEPLIGGPIRIEPAGGGSVRIEPSGGSLLRVEPGVGAPIRVPLGSPPPPLGSAPVQAASMPPASMPSGPTLSGPKHEDVLAALHAILRPRNYLEIGVDVGETLRLAQCASIAIDPGMKIDQRVIGEKPSCLLYRLTSDRFFEKHDPVALFGERIDLAFLDGLHLYEFLLRDFINTERACRRNSIIVLHDCIPTDLYLARRQRADESLRNMTRIPGGWCGDVWKTVLILRKFRPDLRVYAFDSALTGLILITNLDPDSTVLSNRYADAIESFRSLTLGDYGLARYLDELQIKDSRLLFDPLTLAHYFWL